MNTQHQICLPKTVDDLRTTLKSAIAFYQGSPVKNLNKINEALATSLGFSNYDQLSSIIRHEEEIKKLNLDRLRSYLLKNQNNPNKEFRDPIKGWILQCDIKDVFNNHLEAESFLKVMERYEYEIIEGSLFPQWISTETSHSLQEDIMQGDLESAIKTILYCRELFDTQNPLFNFTPDFDNFSLEQIDDFLTSKGIFRFPLELYLDGVLQKSKFSFKF